MSRDVVGGLIFNRAPALPRHSACVFRVPRPKPRLPEKVGTPLRKAARVVRGGARRARPHPWRTEGTGGSRALGPQGVWSSWPCVAQDLRALEGSRPGEEGLISRSEIKARSPPQAAPSNSAARGGRHTQFNGYKPSL